MGHPGRRVPHSFAALCACVQIAQTTKLHRLTNSHCYINIIISSFSLHGLRTKIYPGTDECAVPENIHAHPKEG